MTPSQQAPSLVERPPCLRKCSICEGQDHHWDVFGDTDEEGLPVLSCKHCDATKPMEDDDD